MVAGATKTSAARSSLRARRLPSFVEPLFRAALSVDAVTVSSFASLRMKPGWRTGQIRVRCTRTRCSGKIAGIWTPASARTLPGRTAPVVHQGVDPSAP